MEATGRLESTVREDRVIMMIGSYGNLELQARARERRGGRSGERENREAFREK